MYNKSHSDLSETQRTRLPKLHSLSFAYLGIPWTICAMMKLHLNLVPTHARLFCIHIAIFLLLFIVHTSCCLHASGCTVAKYLPTTSSLYIVEYPAFFMPWWAEPQRHTVVIVCVCMCVCVCVTLFCRFLKEYKN